MERKRTIELMAGRGRARRIQVLEIDSISRFFRGDEKSVLFDYLQARGARRIPGRFAIARRIKRLDALPEDVEFLLFLGSDLESSCVIFRNKNDLEIADSAEVPRYQPYFWIVISVKEEPIK